MGKGVSKYLPKYFKDFNIENRALKKIEHSDEVKAPRHPSTTKMFSDIESEFFILIILLFGQSTATTRSYSFSTLFLQPLHLSQAC